MILQGDEAICLGQTAVMLQTQDSVLAFWNPRAHHLSAHPTLPFHSLERPFAEKGLQTHCTSLLQNGLLLIDAVHLALPLPDAHNAMGCVC